MPIKSYDNNIGALRFLGAFMVLFGHGYTLSAGRGYDPITSHIIKYTPWHLPLQSLGVMMFFVLSGYLVSQSYSNRSQIIHYTVARCLRIYPALIAAVLFCVGIVGAAQTTLPFMEYIRHPETPSYLLNNTSLWSVQVTLPGVFEHTPVPRSVNGSLWTLPIELSLYVVVGIVGCVGLFKKRWLFNIVAVVGGLAFWLYAPKMPASFSAIGAPYLTLSFILGALMYVNRKYIVLNGKAALLMLILCVVIRESRLCKGYYGYLALVPFVYLVIYLAFMSYRLPVLDKYGDFSYGLYLYAYPLQQLSVVWVGENRSVLVNLLAFSGALLLAILSWHMIEKPALARVPGRQTSGPVGQT